MTHRFWDAVVRTWDKMINSKIDAWILRCPFLMHVIHVWSCDMCDPCFYACCPCVHVLPMTSRYSFQDPLLRVKASRGGSYAVNEAREVGLRLGVYIEINRLYYIFNGNSDVVGYIWLVKQFSCVNHCIILRNCGMSGSFLTERSLPSPFWWMVLLPLGHIKKLGPGRVFTLLGLWPKQGKKTRAQGVWLVENQGNSWLPSGKLT